MKKHLCVSSWLGDCHIYRVAHLVDMVWHGMAKQTGLNQFEYFSGWVRPGQTMGISNDNRPYSVQLKLELGPGLTLVKKPGYLWLLRRNRICLHWPDSSIIY